MEQLDPQINEIQENFKLITDMQQHLSVQGIKKYFYETRGKVIFIKSPQEFKMIAKKCKNLYDKKPSITHKDLEKILRPAIVINIESLHASLKQNGDSVDKNFIQVIEEKLKHDKCWFLWWNIRSGDIHDCKKMLLWFNLELGESIANGVFNAVSAGCGPKVAAAYLEWLQSSNICNSISITGKCKNTLCLPNYETSKTMINSMTCSCRYIVLLYITS